MVTAQRASVYLDGELVGFFIKDKTSLFLDRVKIPAGMLDAGGRKVLRLHHPDCARPSEVSGSRDTRRLAFAYKKIALTRPIED